MLIEEAIATQLKGHAGLSALVGNNIFPARNPQGAIGLADPAVTFSRITGERIHAMVADTGLAESRFQVSSWSKSYKTTVDVARQVQLALQDFSGTMGGAGGVTVQRSFIENELDVGFETDAQFYQRASEFVMWHQE